MQNLILLQIVLKNFAGLISSSIVFSEGNIILEGVSIFGIIVFFMTQRWKLSIYFQIFICLIIAQSNIELLIINKTLYNYLTLIYNILLFQNLYINSQYYFYQVLIFAIYARIHIDQFIGSTPLPFTIQMILQQVVTHYIIYTVFYVPPVIVIIKEDKVLELQKLPEQDLSLDRQLSFTHQIPTLNKIQFQNPFCPNNDSINYYIFDVMPCGVLLIDAEKQVIFQNQKSKLFITQNFDDNNTLHFLNIFLQEIKQYESHQQSIKSNKMQTSSDGHSKFTMKLSMYKKPTLIIETTDEYPNITYLMNHLKRKYTKQKTFINQQIYMKLVKKLKDKYFLIKIFQLIRLEKFQYLFLIENISQKTATKLLRKENEFQQQLLNSVCHELRTPLNGIIPQLEYLADELQEKEHKRQIAQALACSKRLLIQLNCMMDYVDINNENFKMDIHRIVTNDMIEGIKDLFALECEQKEIDLQFKCVQQLVIHTDKKKLMNILVLIIENSVKFTKPQGTIIIEFKVQMRNNIQISIFDDGCGIEQNQINKILQKEIEFEKQKKFGLGLLFIKSLSEYIFEENTFQIQSEINIYTKISFVIKNMIQTQISLHQTSIQTKYLITQCDCVKILIVDDIIFNHNAIKIFFKNKQYFCDSCFNGEEAVQKVKEKFQSKCCQAYRFIFMDIEMPIMDGLEAALEIQDFQRNKESQSILIQCSAYSSQKESDCFQENLAKPIQKAQIEFLIQKYF